MGDVLEVHTFYTDSWLEEDQILKSCKYYSYKNVARWDRHSKAGSGMTVRSKGARVEFQKQKLLNFLPDFKQDLLCKRQLGDLF